MNDFRYWLLLFVIVISLTIFFSIGYYNALFGVFFSVIVTLLIFAVIMQHLNKKTSDLKKSTIAHNSMEELRSRLRISSVASSTFFARSDESSTAEASSTIELGSNTFMLDLMMVWGCCYMTMVGMAMAYLKYDSYLTTSRSTIDIQKYHSGHLLHVLVLIIYIWTHIVSVILFR